MDEQNNKRTQPNEFSREHPFRVPDNYFVSFRERLNERIANEQNHAGVAWRTVMKPVLYSIGIASIAVLTFFSVQFLERNNTGNQLDRSGIAALIEDDLYYYEEELLVQEAFSNAEATTESVSNAADEEISQEYADEIIDYLLYNDVELENIVDEL
jgi:hypothetical protein